MVHTFLADASQDRYPIKYLDELSLLGNEEPAWRCEGALLADLGCVGSSVLQKSDVGSGSAGQLSNHDILLDPLRGMIRLP